MKDLLTGAFLTGGYPPAPSLRSPRARTVPTQAVLTFGRERFPNLLASFPQSDPANCPGHQTMPECRINKSTAPSTLRARRRRKRRRRSPASGIWGRRLHRLGGVITFQGSLDSSDAHRMDAGREGARGDELGLLVGRLKPRGRGRGAAIGPAAGASSGLARCSRLGVRWRSGRARRHKLSWRSCTLLAHEVRLQTCYLAAEVVDEDRARPVSSAQGLDLICQLLFAQLHVGERPSGPVHFQSVRGIAWCQSNKERAQSL